jgi:putative lipoprotein
MTLSLRSILAPCFLSLLLGGCAATAAAPSGGDSTAASSARVSGTVSYLQRIALPPSATITVRLVDVSRMDAPAIVLGEQIINAGGKQVPFSFEISYDPARIDPRFTYAVQARIEDAGKLLFITDTRYAVITRGAPNRVDMVLRPVGGPTPK